MENILILHGKKYREEVTLDAIKQFGLDKGIRDLAEFEKVSLSSFEDAELLIFYCLQAGADLDGKKLGITKESIGKYLRVQDVSRFMEIYRAQSEVAPSDLKKKYRS